MVFMQKLALDDSSRNAMTQSEVPEREVLTYLRDSGRALSIGAFERGRAGFGRVIAYWAFNRETT